MIVLRGPLTPGKCSGCGVPVMWAYTKKHRPMILDETPNPTGNCVIDGVVYVTHWATCLEAADFKRKKEHAP